MPEFNPEMPERPEMGIAADPQARATEIFDEAASAWRRTSTMLSREMNERPVRTALISLGAGYLLGGGLFTPLTGRLVGVSLRIALRTLALPALSAGALALGKQFLGEDDDRPSSFR